VRRILCAALTGLALLTGIRARAIDATNQAGTMGMLTNVAQVRELASAMAEKGIPVNLQATVTLNLAMPSWGMMFIHDDSGDIFVNPGTNSPSIIEGDRISVQGVTTAGDFAPIITASQITRIGAGQRPPPIPTTVGQLQVGNLDCKYVELTGWVRNTRIESRLGRLDLSDSSGDITATFSTNEPPQAYRDCIIRIRGIVGGVFNKRRQMTGVTLWSSSFSEITIVEPPLQDPYSLPLTRIGTLREFSQDSSRARRTHIKGVVTARQNERVAFLQDGEDALQFHLGSATSARAPEPGTVLEAVGIPCWNGGRMELRETRFRITGLSAIPPPLKVNEAYFDLDMESRRCAVECDLEVTSPLEEGIVLGLKNGNTHFEAWCERMPEAESLLKLLPGSRLRVTGTVSGVLDDKKQVRGYRVFASSPADIEVLRHGAWWTRGHTQTLVAVVTLFLLAVILWIRSLHHQVQVKTREIHKRLRHEAELEMRNSELVSRASDAVFSIDADGRILSFNPAAEKLTGHSQPDALKMRIQEVLRPESPEQMQAILKRLLREEDIPPTTFKCHSREGREYWVEISLQMLRRDAGTGIMGGIARDITERMHLETMLREQALQARLDAEIGGILSSNDPISALLQQCADALGRHLDASAVRIWTLSHAGDSLDLQASTGMQTTPESPHNHIPLGNAGIGRIACDRTSLTVDDIGNDPTLGDPAWPATETHAFAGYPVVAGTRLLAVVGIYSRAPLSKGLLKGLASTATAMAAALDRFNSKEETERIQGKLQEAQRLESLGILAGGIAHDFNNLLTSILGNANLARLDTPPGSPAIDSLAEIESASRRASELCRLMLDYAGMSRTNPKPVDFSGTIRNAAKLLTHSINKKTELRISLPENPPTVEGDAAQIQQVVMNLVTNAAEAIGEQGGIIRVSAGVMQANEAFFRETYLAPDLPAGKYVFLEVADNGCGMSKETMAKIFDPFYTTKFSGRGLGLAAVWGIVRGHGGAIHVSSSPDIGTKFRVLLPPAESSTTPVIPPPAGMRLPSRARGLVVVIDDEAPIRALVGRLLKRMGFDVLDAADGDSGVALVRKHLKDCVLVMLDLTMPKADGAETLAGIREFAPSLPVVLMSGYSEQDVGKRISAYQTSGFLAKPFTPDMLQEHLQTIPGLFSSGGTDKGTVAR
jgi:PAS domain S-box-containing protein